MMRIEHSDMRGSQVVCVAWKDLKRLNFQAETRPVHSVPLYLGYIHMRLGGRKGRFPVVGVLATVRGELDWHRGCGVIVDSCSANLDDPRIFDFMVKAILLAAEQGIVDPSAAENAKLEVVGMAAKRN